MSPEDRTYVFYKDDAGYSAQKEQTRAEAIEKLRKANAWMLFMEDESEDGIVVLCVGLSPFEIAEWAVTIDRMLGRAFARSALRAIQMAEEEKEGEA